MSPAWFGCLFGVLCALDCVTTGYVLVHRRMREGNKIVAQLMEWFGMRTALIATKLALVGLCVTFGPSWPQSIQAGLIVFYAAVVGHNFWLMERTR